MQCPKCKSRAHRSHRRGVWERFVSLFGYYPYRCHHCECRFLQYRFAATEAKRGDPSPAEEEIRPRRTKIKRKQRRRELLLFSFGAMLFLGFLYYITLQALAR